MEQAQKIMPGLRERNKAEKLQRIRRAARELFIENGYDDTTTRAIAKRADVGLGTLFSYASDKRDLLFLIFNSEIEQVLEEGIRLAQRETILLEQLCAFFSSYYAFFQQQPALSRLMLRELMFYVSGKEAQRFLEGRDKLLQFLLALATKAQEENRIQSREDPKIIAQAFFSTYASELRRWIGNDEPDLTTGMKELRRMLRLQISGLNPGAGVLDD